LLVIACAEQKPEAPADAESKQSTVALSDSLFGVVSARNDTTCLRAPSAWARSDSVLIVFPSDQRVASARIVSEGPRFSLEDAAPGQKYFLVSAPAVGPGDVGIAVLAPGPSTSGGAPTDIDKDGIPEGYRSCTSAEGLHLTVWAAEPLKSRRVWHHYHYLGYDTEPTCVEADYREG
jgi:hypothetical protein